MASERSLDDDDVGADDFCGATRMKVLLQCPYEGVSWRMVTFGGILFVRVYYRGDN